MTYIGIDPGKSGGIAVINGTTIELHAMPGTETDLWNLLKGEVGALPVHALIEKVGPMPRQGVCSVFTFGFGYGQIRMAMIGAEIPFDEVLPHAWQKALGIPKKKKTETSTQWKNRLRAKAQQLYPRLEITLKTADALLIATYLMRKKTGTL